MDPESPRYEFVIDPETGDPHVRKHGLSTDDVLDVMDDPASILKSAGDTYSAYGQSRNGVWLRVIYVERSPSTLRIITAYTPGPKAIRALRRRLGKKR